MSDICTLKSQIRHLKSLYDASVYPSGIITERVQSSKIADSTSETACRMYDIAKQIKSLQDSVSSLIEDKQASIDILPEDLREIAKLKHIDCMSTIKIADHYDRSVRWVKYKLAEIKKAGV